MPGGARLTLSEPTPPDGYEPYRRKEDRRHAHGPVPGLPFCEDCRAWKLCKSLAEMPTNRAGIVRHIWNVIRGRTHWRK
jgi:hypothetical protein